MTELIVFNYLRDNLPAPVYTEVPDSKPDERFVVLEKVGGSEEGMIIRGSFAVQSYAPSLYKAAELNEQVKSVMKDIIGLNSITGVTLDSDYNYTDTSTKSYRYQAVFDLVFF